MGHKTPTKVPNLIITKDAGLIKILISVHGIMPVGRIIDYNADDTGLYAFRVTKEFENVCLQYNEAYFTLTHTSDDESATDAENINLYIDVYTRQILSECQDDTRR